MRELDQTANYRKVQVTIVVDPLLKQYNKSFESNEDDFITLYLLLITGAAKMLCIFEKKFNLLVGNVGNLKLVSREY